MGIGEDEDGRRGETPWCRERGEGSDRGEWRRGEGSEACAADYGNGNGTCGGVSGDLGCGAGYQTCVRVRQDIRHSCTVLWERVTRRWGRKMKKRE